MMGGIPAISGNVETAALLGAAERAAVMDKSGFANELQNHTIFQGLSQPDQQTVMDAMYNVGTITPDETIRRANAAGRNESLTQYTRLLQLPDGDLTNITNLINHVDGLVAGGSNPEPAEKDIIYNQARNKIFRHYKGRVESATTDQEIRQIQTELLASTQGFIPATVRSAITDVNAFANRRRGQITRNNNTNAVRNGTLNTVPATITRNPFTTPIAEANATQLTNMRNSVAALETANYINTEQREELVREIQQRNAELIEAQVQQIDTSGDLTAMVNLQTELNRRAGRGRPLSLSNEDQVRLQEEIGAKRDELSQSIRQELQQRYTQLLSDPKYANTAIRQQELNRLITEIRNRHGTDPRRGPIIDLIGINIPNIVNEITNTRDTTALSLVINTHIRDNPGTTVERYMHTLTPVQIEQYGGRDEIARIFERNTNPEQRREFIRNLAQSSHDNNIPLATARAQLDAEGFKGSQYSSILNRELREYRERKSRQDFTTARGILNKELNWDNLTIEARNGFINTRRKQLEDLMRREGMNTNEITNAIGIFVNRNTTEQALVTGAIGDPRDRGTDFTALIGAINADGTLSVNERQALVARVELMRDTIRANTDLTETIIRRLGGNPDNIRNGLMTARRLLVTGSKAAALAIAIYLLVHGGMPIAGSASGAIPYLGISSATALQGTVLIGGVAGAYYFGSKIAKSDALIGQRNASVRVAMAERRVAEDRMANKVRQTMNALDSFRTINRGGVNSLDRDTREVYEQLGIISGQRIDTTGIVQDLTNVGFEYQRANDNLANEVERKRKNIRQSNQQNLTTQVAQQTGFSVPNNFLGRTA